MRKESRKKLRTDIRILVIKIVLIVPVMLIMYFVFFGIFRVNDSSMTPGIDEGDLVISYRLDKHYSANDLTVYDYKDVFQVRRVVAVQGDTVDISEDGLVINGHLQIEPDIYQETYAYEEGISFPVTLQEGEVFLLADARENATDSRAYGPALVDYTEGVVIAAIRHGGL